MTEDTKLILAKLEEINDRVDILGDVLRQLTELLPPGSVGVFLDGPYEDLFEEDMRKTREILDRFIKNQVNSGESSQ